jgi:hypothetical protein
MTDAKETATPKAQDDLDVDRTVTIAEKTWRALLKIAGRQIDPKTAQVTWHYGLVADPYGVDCDLPNEGKCVGRLYFARNPGSEVWIESGDLPEATQAALKGKPIDDEWPLRDDDYER